MFSTVAAPLYNPTNNVGGSLFSISSLTFIICRPVDDDHSDWCEVLLHCRFDLHFLIISSAEHLSMCLLTIHMSSLKKCLFVSSSHFLFLIRFFFFFVIELYELFAVFWKLSHTLSHHLQIFSPSL